MFLRMIRASLWRQKKYKLIVVVAIALASAVITALSLVTAVVGDKVQAETHGLGPNIIVRPESDKFQQIAIDGIPLVWADRGALLDERHLPKLKKIFWRNNILAFAPMLTLSARIAEKPAIVTGTWFKHTISVPDAQPFTTGLFKISKQWKLQGDWPGQVSLDEEAVVGRAFAKRMGLGAGSALRLKFDQSPQERVVRVAGIIETGTELDDQILMRLETIQNWTGLPHALSQVLVTALTTPEDAFYRRQGKKPWLLKGEAFEKWFCTPFASSIAYQIGQAFPNSFVQPLRKVAEAEGKILGKARFLMNTIAVIAVIAALIAVSSTLVLAVLRRRRELALLKALGASSRDTAFLFVSENLLIALFSGIMGSFIGSSMADYIELHLFGGNQPMTGLAFVIGMSTSILVVLVASLWPMHWMKRFKPAVLLKPGAIR